MQSSRIQSLTRGIEILRQVASSEDGLTLREISELLGVSRPTAHNLATTLVAEDFLLKLEKPVRFRLGPGPERIVESAGRHHTQTAAHDLLRELERRFPGTGWVYAEAEPDHIRIIWRLDFRRPEVIERADREVLHPYDTATALIFHAYADTPRAEAMRRRFPFPEFGRPVWGSRRRFDAFLERIREAGCVAESWSEGREVDAVSAPVFDRHHRLRGSLGAFYPVERAAELRERVLSAVREGARKLGEGPWSGRGAGSAVSEVRKR